MPSSRIRPAVGVTSRTRLRAIVDLPEPDSPTTASEPPRGTLKETSSTARNGPLRVGYSTTSPSTTS